MSINTILLVSADDSMAKSILSCLIESGYKVIHSTKGTSAVDQIQKEKPALVVLDIALPDYNSLAIIRAIREGGTSEPVPIILVGSNMREEDVLIGLEVGADLCLLETFHPQVFIARVHSLLRRFELMELHARMIR
jgi:DNA-binding response OmpR family regulator